MWISGMGHRLDRVCGALLLVAAVTLWGATGAEASPTAARKRPVVPSRPLAPAPPTSALAAAVDPLSDHQYVFWRAADAHLYEAWFDGGWHGPIDTGWNSASPPAVASPGAVSRPSSAVSLRCRAS